MENVSTTTVTRAVIGASACSVSFMEGIGQLAGLRKRLHDGFTIALAEGHKFFSGFHRFFNVLLHFCLRRLKSGGRLANAFIDGGYGRFDVLRDWRRVGGSLRGRSLSGRGLCDRGGFDNFGLARAHWFVPLHKGSTDRLSGGANPGARPTLRRSTLSFMPTSALLHRSTTLA